MGSRAGLSVLALAVGLLAGYGLRPLLDRDRPHLAVLAAELEQERAEVEKLQGELERVARERPAAATPEAARVPVEAPPAPRVRPENPFPPRAEIADVAAARTKLAEILAAGEPSHEVRKLLEQLKKIGSPEAIGFILEIMEMEEITTVQSPFYAELLGGVDDPRIQQVALRVLRRNLEQGLDSWVHTHGFVDLLGQRPDAESAAFLMELLRAGNQAGTFRAARWAKELLPFAGAAELFALAESNLPLAESIYASLASSEDPALLETMLAICKTGAADAIHYNPANFAARELGRWQEADFLQAQVSTFWSGSDPKKVLALNLIRGMTENHKITPEVKLSIALPVLEQSVIRPDLGPQTLELISENRLYHVPEVAGMLERLLLTAPRELQGPLKQTLQEISRTLASNSR